VRIFALWGKPPDPDEFEAPEFDRVSIPGLSPREMFDDAFRGIARDGAGQIEVVVHLLKGLRSLASCSAEGMSEVAAQHAREALARAEGALDAPADLVLARELAQFAGRD